MNTTNKNNIDQHNIMNNTTVIETLGNMTSALVTSLHVEVFQLISFAYVMFDSSFDDFHRLLGLCTIWYYHLVLGNNDLFEFLIYFNILIHIYNISIHIYNLKTHNVSKNADEHAHMHERADVDADTCGQDEFFRDSRLNKKCFDEKSTLDDESNLSTSSLGSGLGSGSGSESGSSSNSKKKTKPSNDGHDRYNRYDDDKFEDEYVEQAGVRTEEVKGDGGGKMAVSILVVEDENQQSDCKSESDNESESEIMSDHEQSDGSESDKDEEEGVEYNYAIGQ